MRHDLTIKTSVDDDWNLIYQFIAAAFNEDGDEASNLAERATFEPDRTLLAYHDSTIAEIVGPELVGTASAYTRRLAVPGGAIPAAHVSMVAVAPTARRQGILSTLIQRQLTELRSGGEPIAVLWATEGRIYQRFGYGMASRRMSLTIDNREVRLTTPAPAGGRLRTATVAEARAEMVKVYARTYPDRPGFSERHDRTWDFFLADTAVRRGEHGPLRVVLHYGPAGVNGYALFRVKGTWDEAGPAGEVLINEVVTSDPIAYARLWQFLLTMDLTRTAKTRNCATDEPLQYLSSDPRRMGAHVSDALWLRIVDLPRALRARAYVAPVDVVLQVSDVHLPENNGRWRLTITPAHTRCVRSDEPADLTCDIGALGAAYLGGVSFAALALTGRVSAEAGVLAELTNAFGWHRAPACSEVF